MSVRSAAHEDHPRAGRGAGTARYPGGGARLATDDSASELAQLRSEVGALKTKLDRAEDEAAQAHAEARAAQAARDAAVKDAAAKAAAAREAAASEAAAKDAAAMAAAAAAAPTAKRRIGWRGPVSTLLIVLGCVLAPISVLAVWTSNQVSDTSKYVQNISPLVHEPAVRSALTDKITTALSKQINVQAVANQAAKQLSAKGLTRLGALISNFSGSIASGVDGLIHSTVARIVASPLVTRLWIQGNTVAHQQLVLALQGKKSAISVSDGKVVIGLGPFIDQVKHHLAARGLTLVNKLPRINPTFPLFSATYLVQAQSFYRLLTTLRWVLPILTIILLAAGVYVARRHRRALVGAGLGLAASMLVLGAALAIGRTIYISKIPASTLPADAAAVVFDDLVRFITQGLRVILVLGLIIAIAGFFTGPSVTAVRTRDAFTSAFGAIRGTGEKAGLSTGPIGTWIYRYRVPLRIAAAAVAGLVLVFLSSPTGLDVLVIAIVLLAVLGLIELIGRPPARPRPAGPSSSGNVDLATFERVLSMIVVGFPCYYTKSRHDHGRSAKGCRLAGGSPGWRARVTRR
jgi:hypothetical protein